MIRLRLLPITFFLVVLAACTALTEMGGNVTAQSEETQSVIVPGVPSLVVNHFAGTLTIRDGEADKITANLTRKSHLDNEADAQAQLDLITMRFTQSGSDVTLFVEGPDEAVEFINGPSADLEVFVPPGTTLDINQGAGDLTVERPSGDVEINLGAGNATVTLPEAASFALMVSGGVGDVNSDFEGVPSGGIATDINITIGSSPTQTLTFNVGAGDININKAP